jgi:hypothetical protein
LDSALPSCVCPIAPSRFTKLLRQAVFSVDLFTRPFDSFPDLSYNCIFHVVLCLCFFLVD